MFVNGVRVGMLTAKVRKDEFIHNQVKKVATAISAPEIKNSNFKVLDNCSKFPATMRPDQSYNFQLTMRNNGFERLTVNSLLVIPSFQGFSVKTTNLDRSPIHLDERQSKILEGTYIPKSYGMYDFHIHIGLNNGCRMVHTVHIHVKNEEDLKIIGTTKSRWVEPTVDSIVRKIVPAFPPNRVNKSHFLTPIDTPFLEKLPIYPIPEDVQVAIDNNAAHKDLNAWKTKANYINRMQTLLWIEEAQEINNIRRFDLKEAKLLDHDQNDEQLGAYIPEYLYLVVEGLAEKRPSVLVRDVVYVWVPGSRDYEYEGVVQKVFKDKIALVFCQEFKKIFPDRSTKFNVRFEFSRVPKRIMHRALTSAKIDIIWPEKKPLVNAAPNWKSKNEIDWKDVEVSRNEEQAHAVLSVVNRAHGDIPFLLFGAFGCGKSRTLLEMIIQILKNNQNAKVLICTQSNSAADYFAKNLVSVLSTNEMHRLYASQYQKERVNDSILPYTQFDKDSFNIPDLNRLKQFKVIISTCNTAASLYGVGMGANHFTHILLDEASQMMEPEALIPISMASTKTSIVMAGDDKQIGPIIYSKSAIHHKMGESIMWRISQLDAYDSLNDKRTCIHLKMNYRSHSAILNFLSLEFYKGHSLVQKGPKSIVESLQNWGKLPRKGFPVMFQSVEGEDKQSSDDPSFFNIEEASTIRDLVKNLTFETGLAASDIGIISPYYKQVKTIRKLLPQSNIPNWRDIKVGSPEEFQGSERKAIFISCVRSSRSYLAFDQEYSLGILKNEKRMNSAFSRAGCLLVVVGNPYILGTDEHWNNFLDYCRENKSYIGPESSKVQQTIQIQEKKEEEDREREKILKKQKELEDVEKAKKEPQGRKEMDWAEVSRKEPINTPPKPSPIAAPVTPIAPIAAPSRVPDVNSNNVISQPKEKPSMNEPSSPFKPSPPVPSTPFNPSFTQFSPQTFWSVDSKPYVPPVTTLSSPIAPIASSYSQFPVEPNPNIQNGVEEEEEEDEGFEPGYEGICFLGQFPLLMSKLPVPPVSVSAPGPDYPIKVEIGLFCGSFKWVVNKLQRNGALFHVSLTKENLIGAYSYAGSHGSHLSDNYKKTDLILNIPNERTLILEQSPGILSFTLPASRIFYPNPNNQSTPL
eukprot:TRINITY_DN4618_c0_g2_i4.p1 TRINITY_DN4618_c0_g2~~TRINITY_DN4618_c0_g2_i4.p1  ORF type:complete len:1138 (+),score=362.50 TRINITY_DN4618_c0_g2_i4:190-3603(+)